MAVKAAGWAMLLRILICRACSRCARDLGSGDCLRLHCDHDGRQFRGAHADEYEAPARLLLDRARRIHAARPGRRDIADRTQLLDGIKGILIYLLVYTFMNLGAFA